MITTTLEPTLKQQWEELLVTKPQTRIRDAADELGVSELDLLITGLGDNVLRLDADWPELVKEFPRLGPIMCLTRNDAAVHERHGTFQKMDFFRDMGQVFGPDIDLRLFFKRWHYGFAVNTISRGNELQSLQFFDKYGTAVHKIYLQKESNFGAYGVMLAQFRHKDQSAESISVLPKKDYFSTLPDSEIDVEGIQNTWRNMKDTHEFYMMLPKYHVKRGQILNVAPDETFARRVPLSSTKHLLEQAAATALPIMVFIGSSGVVQIHCGPVKNIKMFGKDWLNIMDEKFTMHLYEPLVKSAWVVFKPTLDGGITSLELLDENGDDVVIFYGKRIPGNPELPEWRELVNSLPSEA